ncbi:hypothetical protein [Trueperella bernardiae]|uniref:hypothetical protein n=1 Tax=Trueperella bernardiae TaxID=59561 RepID=UPI00204338F3|nr:hypothetical protein [Trueperella bernardiae]MCM3908058.1 hypothetical protein [Trueperella bernardiae]
MCFVDQKYVPDSAGREVLHVQMANGVWRSAPPWRLLADEAKLVQGYPELYFYVILREPVVLDGFELESMRAIFENPRKACKATFAGLMPGLGQRRPVFLGAKVSHVLPPMLSMNLVGGCTTVWSWGVSALGRAYTRLSLSGRSDTKAGVRRDG